MNTIRVGGWRLGLDSLATEGAGVLVGVWPDQQQAGQDTQQRSLLFLSLVVSIMFPLVFCWSHGPRSLMVQCQQMANMML